MQTQPIEENQKYCQHCGEVIFRDAEICPKCGRRVMEAPTTKSTKDKTTAGLLALFLGGLGVHKFYLGENGIIYFLFFWTGIPMILGLIDAIKIFKMSDTEFSQKYA